MKLLLAFLLLLSACGKAPVGYDYSNWEELNGLRRFEFGLGTVRYLHREVGEDWQESGTYRYEFKDSGFIFYTESGEIVSVAIIVDSQDQFRVTKFGQVSNWIPATYRRVP